MAGQFTRFRGFVGQTYNLPNWNYDCQRTINRYVEYNETGYGKDAEPAQLVPTPGLTALITGLDGPSRGGYTTSTNVCYRVFGNKLYQISGAIGSFLGWTATVIGYIQGSGNVIFADNGTTLFMVTQPYGIVYLLDLPTNTITVAPQLNSASNSGYPPASSCTYMDGYVVFTQLDSNQFFWTDLYSTYVPGVNFAAAETNADNAVAVYSNAEYLWVFCEKVTEIWYDAGQGNTTFARTQGILIETGCSSPFTIEKINSTLMWLSTDERGGPIVFLSQGPGGAPLRVSTFAVEAVLNQATSDQLRNARADSHQWNGHYFYSLQIPGINTTFVFDLTTYQQSGKPTWHERQSGYGVNATAWIAMDHNYFVGQHLFGDASIGTLYALDSNSALENGSPVERTRITPHISSNECRIRYNKLQIDYTQGSTTDFANNAPPMISMSYSDDGGKTYSNPQICSLGAVGQYANRVVFYQMGVSRNRVYKVVDVANTYTGISGASLNIEVGNS